MKRILYYTYIVIQGLVLAVTLANVVYCFATQELVNFGVTTYPLLFVPFYKFNNGGSLLNILTFIAFASFSVYVYIRSAVEFFNCNLRKGIFIGVNFLWLLFSSLSCSALNFDLEFSDFVSGEYGLSIAPLLLGLAAWLVKVGEMHNVIRADKRDGEDFLPEEFQLDAKSYKQIERTAKGMPWLAGVSFAVSLLLVYVGGEKFIGMLWINFIYIATAFLIVSNFFICIQQTKKFEKKTGIKMPSEVFLKKINLLHIVTFVLFVASYFVVFILSINAFDKYL